MAILTETQYAALDAMGIPVWFKQDQLAKSGVENIKAVANESAAIPAADVAADLVLPLLGNVDAPILFIGENLAVDGNTPSSRLLLAMLFAIGLGRDDIAVLSWQADQLALLKTHFEKGAVTQIVILGEQASQDCFAQQSIDSLRRQKQQFSNIDTWISYHPAELCLQPANKAAAWQDLQKLRSA